MSLIIVFPDGTDWFKANWVFRQLAKDLSHRYRSDAEVCEAMELADALGMLNLKEMDDGLRRRLMEALLTVAVGTIEGRIAGWRPHDVKEHAMYGEAVSDLAERLKSQGTVTRSSG